MTHGLPNFSQVQVDYYRAELNGRGHRRVQAQDCRQYHAYIEGVSKPVLRVIEQFEVFDFSLVGIPVQGVDNLLNLLGRGKLVLVAEHTPLMVYPETAAYADQTDPSHPVTNRKYNPATEDGGVLPRTAAHQPPPPPAPNPPFFVPPPVDPVVPVVPPGEAQGGGEAQAGGPPPATAPAQ